MIMSRTIGQKRATFALEFITAYEGDPASRDKIHTHINKTPIRILQNGLGQALAFLLADAEGRALAPARVLYGALDDWLCGTRLDPRPCRVYADAQGDLMAQLVRGDRVAYIRAQEEALQLFTWLKKFADAYLDRGAAPNKPAGAH